MVSFAGGFLIANSLNRRDLTELRAEIENLKNAQAEIDRDKQESTLSDDQIRGRIAEADANPNNIEFQKKLGLALYNYASMRENTDLLREVERLINRVYAADPNDYTAIVTLANINFDIGYFNKNNENLKKAREFYQKALRLKPTDADTLTDLGLTYFLVEPPEIDQALIEFQKSLRVNPKNERTLQVLIEALKKTGKTEEAEKYTTRLKETNPNNESLKASNTDETGGENNLQK